VNAAYITTLQASLAAFGPVPDLWHTALAYLVGVTIGTVMPTPAGIGGTEAGLVAVMTRVGVLQGQAVAATLSFRLVTFWLPILPGLALAGVLRRRGEL
jgi:undecaprenyl-diphosphatase